MFTKYQSSKLRPHDPSPVASPSDQLPHSWAKKIGGALVCIACGAEQTTLNAGDACHGESGMLPAKEMTREMKVKLLAAYDALVSIANGIPWTGHRLSGFKCGECGTIAASNPPHAVTCSVGAAMKALQPGIPPFAEREEWLGT